MITEGGGTFPPGSPAVSTAAAAVASGRATAVESVEVFAEPALPLSPVPEPQAVAAKSRIPRLAPTKFFIIPILTGFRQYYFPHFFQSATSSSSHRRSSSSNVFKAVLSISNTATTSSPSKTGTTISERDRLLQAI